MWKICKTPISFRGRMGFTRTTRKDEILVYREEDHKLDIGVITDVLGRKAWRVKDDLQLKAVESVVKSLNYEVITETKALEEIERIWVQHGSHKA